MSKHVLSQMIVNSILNLLLREGGVPVGGGGRWIHNPVIYKEIGINIIFPTTSVFDHSSFPKEENGDTTDFSVNPYLRVSQALYENKKL